jgi:hypothetical protein
LFDETLSFEIAINANQIKKSLLSTGLFEDFVYKRNCIKLKNSNLMFDCRNKKWSLTFVCDRRKYFNYLSFEEAFEKMEVYQQEALIWHLDILR